MKAPTHASRRRKSLLALAIAVAPFSLCRSASADKYWINAVTYDNWNTSADWNASSPGGSGGAGVPGTSDNVYLNNSTSSNYTVTLNANDQITSLQIGNTGGGSDVVSQTAGSLTISGSLSTGYYLFSNGGYSQSGGTLTVDGNANVGDNGFGTLSLSGTADGLVDANFYVGTNTGGIGTCSLSGSSQLTVQGGIAIGNAGTANLLMSQNSEFGATDSIVVGSGGAATFNQGGSSYTGADQSLDVGYLTAGVGTYILGGTGELATGSNEFVGVNGTGTFLQSGGYNYLFSGSDTFGGSLSIGDQAGGKGYYSLSGGSIANASQEIVGNYGAGTFIQSGGTNSPENLYLGGQSGGVGTYNLSGTGSLNVTANNPDSSEVIDDGTFTQTGGINATRELYLGTAISGNGGYYNLSGSGSLSASDEVLGSGGIGTFQQTGGTNSANRLVLGQGPGGKGYYSLTGTGSLNASGTLTESDSEYIGGNTLFAEDDGAGTFLQTAGTNSTGTLNIGATTGASGYYSLTGTGSLNASGTLLVSGSESIGGNIAYTQLNGVGTFLQTAGTNSSGTLILGANAEATGYYSLTGAGTVLTGTECIGDGGVGTFNQTGGIHTVGTPTAPGELDLASASGGTGVFLLSGGSCTVNGAVYVGGSSSGSGGSGSSGSLEISGGSISVSGTLKIFDTTGTSVSLGAGGELSAGTIDNSGDADDLVWTGGTLNITGSSGLIIGSSGLFPHLNFNSNTTLSVTQSLAVSGGTLTQNSSTSAVYSATEKLGLGSGSAGVHTQSAGSNYTNTLTLGIGSGSYGTYNLSGTGSLTVNGNEFVSAGGAGTFNQTGGLHTIGTPALPQQLEVAAVSGGAGTYLLSGGSVTVNGSVYVGGSSGGAGGAGDLAISGGSMSCGSLTVYAGSTLSQSAGALAIGSDLINNGSTTFSGGGTPDTSIDGTGSLAATSGTSLTATHIAQSTLTIDSSSTVTIADSTSGPGNPNSVSVLATLTNAGTLDLKNNDLIVTTTSAYSTIKALINNAADGGAWDQRGVTSSSALARRQQYGLGYATATQAGTTSFDGQSVSGAETLVKYTLLGDTQLRGTVGLGDYNTVVNNYGTAQDWSGGDFHYGGVVGIGDYDDVLTNYGAHASGSIAVGPSLTRSISPAASINPAVAKTDLKLEVNTTTGDVYILATASAAFTGYTISDPTAHLLGGSTSPDPDKLLSVAAGNGGNTNVYETSGTYVDWFKITETASQVAEGQQQNGFGTHSSRDDTINIPAGGTIDFGDIFNTAASQQDLTFDFAEAGTEPTNGPTYYGAEVDYVTTPEPATVGLVSMGVVGALARRRRRCGGSAR